MSANFAVVIPAFNPGEIVLSVMSSLETFVDRIVLVDDGSNAENKKYLSSFKHNERVTLISLPENRGKGYALIAGMKEAIAHSPDYIITIDSDGQHDPEEIPKFREFLRTTAAPPDLLIGTRDEIDRMPLRSKVGNVFTSHLFNLVFGRKIVDTQSGFRVFSLGFARELVETIKPGRYETEMRMLIHAVRSRRRILEMKIATIYLEENANSKFRPLNDSLRVLAVFSRYAAVAFTSFLLDYSLFLVLAYTLNIHYIEAHAAARICSGVYNFFANRRLVFKSSGKTIPQVLRYCGTVAFSLSLSVLLLYFLVDQLGISKAVAKPFAEFMLFLLNFIILNKLVFRSGKE